jgi:hypothetical protein
MVKHIRIFTFILLITVLSFTAYAEEYVAVFDDPENWLVPDDELPTGQAIETIDLLEGPGYDIESVDNIISPENYTMGFYAEPIMDFELEYESDNYFFSMRDYTGFGIFEEIYEKLKQKFTKG